MTICHGKLQPQALHFVAERRLSSRAVPQYGLVASLGRISKRGRVAAFLRTHDTVRLYVFVHSADVWLPRGAHPLNEAGLGKTDFFLSFGCVEVRPCHD